MSNNDIDSYIGNDIDAGDDSNDDIYNDKYTDDVEELNEVLLDQNRINRVIKHTERVQKEISNMTILPVVSEKDKKYIKNKKNSLISKNFNDLKVVNCAMCGALLLGESDEPFRDLCLKRKVRYITMLPPKIGKRAFGGRPFCEVCALKVKDNV